MNALKSFFKQARSAHQRRRTVEAAFGENGFPCGRCGRIVPFEGLRSLAFEKCPKCGAATFVPLRVKDFVLFEPAGAGGRASVYKAGRRDDPDRLYAVKVLLEEEKARPDSVKAFLREAEIHAQIQPHPNIVRFVESGRDDAEYYHAMEFVEGRRLKSLLEAGERIPEPETLRLVIELLSALQHIYACGFLYRDINAGNVILRPNGRLVLIDFGLALPVEEAAALDEPGAREIEGTADFLPPERVVKSGEDACSVLYSVGLLMYWMLKGEPYIKAKSMAGKAIRHVSSLRVAASATLAVECRPETAGFIDRLTRQDPNERFQTFGEAEAVLRKLAENFSVRRRTGSY
jgi:serine/threonine-protein kinase